MELLKERIRKDGVVKEGNVLKVDRFLNHQMDVKLFREIGKEFKKRFEGEDINKILTIEASGIGIACVVAEIFVFLWMNEITKRFELKNILLFSFSMAIIRFLCIAWGAHSLILMLFSQVLHAFTFGTFHAAAVALVHYFFRGKHQAKGQALYISFSFGAGGTLGGLYSGYTWERIGETWTFLLAALFAFFGLVLVLKLKTERA